MLSRRESAIDVTILSKKYSLGSWAPGPMNWIRQKLSHANTKQPEFWALKDISFSVHPGEVLGIIGHNGAGKSTILKILAGVTKPTTGQITIDGRLSALIELGAGFHPELSGKENIYLNGTILGLKRREIDNILDEIISFSELENFIDTPVKHYSSGMYARLGFSIAVHVNPDVLLVDEVLSVGDIGFQQKSLQRMLDFKSEAKAMVFISHNMAAIQAICNKVIWLESGRIRAMGASSDIIPSYQYASTQPIKQGESTVTKNAVQNQISITKVALQDIEGNVVLEVAVGQPASFVIVVDNHNFSEMPDVLVAMAIYRQDGIKCGEVNSIELGEYFVLEHGSTIFRVNFSDLHLVPGDYYVNVAVSRSHLVQLAHVSFAAKFKIKSSIHNVHYHGFVYFDSKWSVVKSEIDQ